MPDVGENDDLVRTPPSASRSRGTTTAVGVDASSSPDTASTGQPTLEEALVLHSPGGCTAGVAPIAESAPRARAGGPSARVSLLRNERRWGDRGVVPR